MAATYFIEWKGRRDGPYSLEQLAGMLDHGDIGMLHRVETPSGIVMLKQLLADSDEKRWEHLRHKPPPAAEETSAPSASPTPPEANVTPVPLWPPVERNPAEIALNRFPGHHSVSEIPDIPVDSANPSSAILGSPPPPLPPGQPIFGGKRGRGSSGEPAEVMQAYAMSGLCFLFPPYFYWVWKRAGDLQRRGYMLAADRLKWIGMSLTAGGLLFWLFLWGIW